MQIFNYIIGDIHGCFQELILLEKKILDHSKKNDAKPFIISVGDLIDRGPDSNKVVQHFMAGSENGTHTAIMGNHEAMMLETLRQFAPDNFNSTDRKYPYWLINYEELFKRQDEISKNISWEDFLNTMQNMWINQGGAETLTKLNCNIEDITTWKIDEKIISYLTNLPAYWENEKVIITHALAKPDDLIFFKNLANYESSLEFMEPTFIWDSVNSLLWNRELPNEKIDRLRIHVSGHTPINKAKRYKKQNCVQIDTGCVYGGSLTAYCLETEKIISVKALNNYFKDL